MTPLSAEELAKHQDACKKCRASIVWATTPSGRAIPIDPDLVFGGNIELALDQVGMLRATTTRPAGDVEHYVAHFTTCPDAEAFRKPKPEPAADHGDQLVAKREALQCTMPFGKYVGETLEQIDRTPRGHSYLKWAYETLRFRDPKLKRAVGVVTGLEEP